MGLCLCAVSCGTPSQKASDVEFIDSVAEALTNGGQIDLNQLQWTREPAACEIKNGTISITTAPHTDLWQRTYYHFRNDNAPVLQMQTKEKFFSFVVKTDFTQSHRRFDQCGIVMYLDSDNWLKGSVEFENEDFQHLGSVATNNGYSDWATTAISAEVKTVPTMESTSARCASATCMPQQTRLASAFMPALRKNPPSRQCSRI